jgi:hypothetical protein
VCRGVAAATPDEVEPEELRLPLGLEEGALEPPVHPTAHMPDGTLCGSGATEVNAVLQAMAPEAAVGGMEVVVYQLRSDRRERMDEKILKALAEATRPLSVAELIRAAGLDVGLTPHHPDFLGVLVSLRQRGCIIPTCTSKGGLYYVLDDGRPRPVGVELDHILAAEGVGCCGK